MGFQIINLKKINLTKEKQIGRPNYYNSKYRPNKLLLLKKKSSVSEMGGRLGEISNDILYAIFYYVTSMQCVAFPL